jgi:ubiquinone/menaquinone biosynthesis C-methylase UbiE
MNSLNTYSNKAQDYAAYRPDYSKEAFQSLFDNTELDSNWSVADIGSGTGNVAMHLVDHVKQIFAVEPNEAMRNQAELHLSCYTSFRSIAGTAERTSLPSHSVEIILVGQSLHWFDHDATSLEFNRILKPGGWLAIIWNEFGKRQHLNLEPYFKKAEFKRYTFSKKIRETWQQFIGGSRSAAGSPNRDDFDYDAFEEKHRKIFNSRAVDGSLEVEFRTELVLGRLNRRTKFLSRGQ